MKVHITQGGLEGKSVIISWVTPEKPGSNRVVYWAENSPIRNKAEGSVVSYKYFNYTSGFIHHCTIENLEVCVLLLIELHLHSEFENDMNTSDLLDHSMILCSTTRNTSM